MPLLIGVSARALAGGFAFGLYQTIWPIYLKDIGGKPWDVSMSWTLFALPAIFLAALSGKAIDRYGPGPSAVIGALFSAVVVGCYALTRRIEVLLFLCMIEGIGFAFAYPAQNTLTVQAASDTMRGRVIGVVTAVKTGGALIGALLTAELYQTGAWAAFGTTSIVLVAGAIALAVALVVDHRRPHPPTAVALATPAESVPSP